MNWVYISDVGKYEGQDITLKGWLYNKRSSGKLHFLQVRDGSGTIQAVVSKADVSPDAFDAAGRLTRSRRCRSPGGSAPTSALRAGTS